LVTPIKTPVQQTLADRLPCSLGQPLLGSTLFRAHSSGGVNLDRRTVSAAVPRRADWRVSDHPAHYVMRKLPHVTLLFWMMEIIAVTLGETAGDCSG
jgi:hypothetical protein